MKNVLVIFALALVLAFYGCKQKEKQEQTQQSEETTTQKPSEPAQTEKTTAPEQAKETEGTAKEAPKAVDGAQIFQKNKCSTCHQPDTDSAGPSLQKIAQTYKDKNANITAFLKGEAEPIVDPSKAAMMKPLLMPLKSLSEEELKVLADYILQ